MNININEEILDRDIEILINYSLEVLDNKVSELSIIKKNELYFSKNELSEKRLQKVSDKLFDIYRDRTTDIIVKKINNLVTEYEIYNSNEVLKIHKHFGMAFGVLYMICIGNLICDSNDNPFKELYKSHIENIKVGE